MNYKITLLLLIAIAFQSCTDLQITKRRYRPGYHIQSGGVADGAEATRTKPPKRKRTGVKPQLQETEFLSIRAIESVDITTPSEMEEPVLASIEFQPSFLNVNLGSRLIQEARRVRKERKKSFVDGEENEHKWSKMAITSFALGGTGFMVALTAIILMFVAQNNGGLNTTYAGTGLIMAATNIFIGIGGVLFGVAAKREIQRYGHKGRGFRKAGFVSGLISLGSVIGVLLVALIMLANSCNAIE